MKGRQEGPSSRIRSAIRPRSGDSGGAVLRVLVVTIVVWALGIMVGIPAAVDSYRRITALAEPLHEWVLRLPAIPDEFRQPRGDPSLLDRQPARAAPEAPRSAPGSVRDALRSVVEIRMVGCGRIGIGSGFVFDNDRVMTTAHVVRGSDEIRIDTPAGQRLGAQVVLFDARTDVAVLAVPGLEADPLPFGPAPAGTYGFVAGYPDGGPLRAVSAHVLGTRAYGWNADRETLVLASQVRPGNSGGPVLDERGRVLGVVYAAARGDDTRGFALTAAAVADEARTGAAAAAATPVDTGQCR